MAQSTNIASADNENVSISCNNFTGAFYKELSSMENENIVCSPISVHTILSLLSHGADTATLVELTNGLHHSDTISLKEGYKSLITLLNGVKDVELYITNALFIQHDFILLPEFMSVGAEVYQSEISSLNFLEKPAAVERINTFVKTGTRDKISDIVSADDFNDDTKLVLVNAVYFNGHWLHKFDGKNTEKRVFHLTKSEITFVPTMFTKSKYNHGDIQSLNATFIEIPYVNNDIVMTIILPNEVDGLQTVENNFNWKYLAEASRSYETLELFLPRFKFETTINLKNVLCKMGMNSMFEKNADFSRISNIPLLVSKVLHKAVIEVNEQGTEAAAATVVTMRLRRMIDTPKQFLVNRPFMFIIEHKPSNIPLFIGSVKNIKAPAEKDEL